MSVPEPAVDLPVAERLLALEIRCELLERQIDDLATELVKIVAALPPKTL